MDTEVISRAVHPTLPGSSRQNIHKRHLLSPEKKPGMACCCVSEARQSSPDVSERSKPLLKKTELLKEHLYEAINTAVVVPAKKASPLQGHPPRSPGAKVSRGTQVNNVTPPLNGRDARTSRSPPLPAKTAVVLPRKCTPPPPVPPKPRTLTAPAKASPPVRVKPALLPKPSLPPKPSISAASRTQVSSAASPTKSPDRPRRQRVHLPSSVTSSVGSLSPGTPLASPKLPVSTRKTSSLGRLEAPRYAAAIQENVRDLEKLPIWAAHSVERVSRPGGVNTQVPVAPPRRRRKSVDACRDVILEPIYAMVDFSKKVNRRSLTEKENTDKKDTDKVSATENVPVTPVDLVEAINDCVSIDRVLTDLGNQIEEAETSTSDPGTVRSPSKCSIPSQLEVIVEVSSSSVVSEEKSSEESVSDVDCSAKLGPVVWCYPEVNPETETIDAGTGSKIDIDMESKMHRFEATDSGNGSSTQKTGTSDPDIRTATDKVSGIAPKIHKFEATDSDIESNIRSIEDTRAYIDSVINSFSVSSSLTLKEPSSGQPEQNDQSIVRLVVGGAVIETSETPRSEAENCDTNIVTRREKMKEFCTVLEDVIKKRSLTGTSPVVKEFQREPSPTSSTSSSNSDSGPFTKPVRIFEDELSTGILGDVDTSDAARQSSLDDDTECPDDNSNGFQIRKKLAAVFGSFGKPLRRAGAKKNHKNSEESSSTEADGERMKTAHQAPVNVVIEVDRSETAQQDEPSDLSCKNQSQRNSGAAEGDTASILSGVSIDSAAQSSVVGTSLLEESYEADPSATPHANSDSEAEDSELNPAMKSSRKAYYTACEICSSERVFVDCLRLLNRDFRAAMKESAGGGRGPVIPDAELDKILNFLPQLQHFNEELLADFEARILNWDNDPRISDVIIYKGPFLKLYSSYIRDFESQCALLDECIHKYPRFKRALMEFEATPRCGKLSVRHYMLKPVQRLPQYRLLLAEYLRRLDETSPDFTNTVTALKVVSEVADHANNTMKLDDNFQRLMKLQARMGNYELIKPGRIILREGELNKLCRKTLQPRYFILLNDCLLYTSYVGSASASCSLKLHNELPLARMKVNLPVAQDYENEFSVISTTRSFTLAANSSQARDDWIAALTDAIKDYESKLASLKPENGDSESEKRAPLLGQQAPVWIPDSRVTMCQLCMAEFTVTFRRHHCRACGKVVCGNCSDHKAPLEYLKFRSARVCDDCVDTLNQATSATSSTVGLGSSLATASVAIFDAIPRRSYEDDKERPHSDPFSQSSTAQAGHRAQVKRQNRKGKRYIPQRLKEVSANDAGSQMSGYLWRRGKRAWKRAWFVLKDRVLYFYRACEDVVALDSVPVLGFSVLVPDENFGIEKELVFQLCHPSQQPLTFYAENATLAKRWLDTIKAATVL